MSFDYLIGVKISILPATLLLTVIWNKYDALMDLTSSGVDFTAACKSVKNWSTFKLPLFDDDNDDNETDGCASTDVFVRPLK